MACCGRTRPLGAQTQKATAKTAKAPTTSTSKTPPAPAPKRTPTASSFQTFTLEQRDGSTQTFGSRLEAEAARIRSGGGTVR